jgi:hypothetical protein
MTCPPVASLLFGKKLETSRSTDERGKDDDESIDSSSIPFGASHPSLGILSQPEP